MLYPIELRVREGRVNKRNKRSRSKQKFPEISRPTAKADRAGTQRIAGSGDSRGCFDSSDVTSDADVWRQPLITDGGGRLSL